MKKVKMIIVLAAILAMTVSTVAYAAPSPVAGTVTIVLPGNQGASNAQIQAPTQKQLQDMADFIAQNATTVGMDATVKQAISIVAPADYKGGDVPVVLATAGLKNGAQNVFAYLLLPNGKTIILPCTVKNGYVGFVAPAFGTVAIVELNPIVGSSVATDSAFGSSSAATAVAPAKLH